MGQTIDEVAFLGGTGLKDRLWWLAEPLLDVVSVMFILGAIIITVGIALLRKQWWLAVQAAILIGGANATTQILKKVIFERPDFDLFWTPANSLPSGHTTAAASISLALLFVVPRAWRHWAAAIGAVYTGAIGVSTMVGQWHRFSDVVAAIFVAGAWALIMCAFTANPSNSNAEPSTPAGSKILFGLFTLGTVLTGLLTHHYLKDAYSYWDTTALHDAGIQRDAFLGASFAVVCASLAVFGFCLLTRQATARMR